jgi:NADH:ubiquinone oxidoreductase subunit C
MRVKKTENFNEETYAVHPEDYRALLESLKAEGFDYPMNLTGMDTGYGLRVVVHLYALESGRRATVFTEVPYDAPEVPSITDLWPGFEWFEREAYDLVGLRFTGHPDLRRILIEEHWTIHPLQKRYDTGGYPIPGWAPKPWPEVMPWDEPLAEAAEEGGEA